MQAYIYTLSQYFFWGNTAWEYLYAFGLFVIALLVLKFFQVIILARLNHLAKKTATDLDDTFIEIVSGVRPPFYFLVSLYVATQYLYLNDIATKVTNIIFLAIIVFEAVHALEKLIVYSAKKYVKKQHDQVTDEELSRSSIIHAISIASRLILWSLGLLFVLQNLGVNVTSLITGLGIGGIAVAIAVQQILSDLFSSFSIYFDEPFQVGDFIIAGTDAGTVEKIGLKSTRIRTLRGEELVVPNKDLTSARVQNLKRMERRREVLLFGVEYETTATQLRAIPKVLKEIITKVPKATFDRCHFVAFGDSALQFECVYFVEDTDYMVYLNAKQKIHLAMKSRFEKEGILFAYPTQTVHLIRAEA